MGTLPLGAHLMTPRRWYRHHGIYVGDGRVVHYAGLNRRLRAGPVEEIQFSRFEAGRGIVLIDRGPGPYAPDEVIRRARSRLGENRYSVLRNNCEHFSEWCISGEPRSSQVDRWLAAPRRVLHASMLRARNAMHRVGESIAARFGPARSASTALSSLALGEHRL